MIEFTVLENGKLRLKFDGDEDDRDELECIVDEQATMSGLLQITEQYWTNGWGVASADELGQMSESPVIAAEMYIEDDGSTTIHGKAWYYGNYMIYNLLEKILNDGYVDFDFWAEFDNENFPSVY